MAGSRGYGHYGNYTSSGYSNYNSTALPYSSSSSSFSSNYYSSPSYGHHHHVASPGSRGVSAGLSLFNFDLPRTISYGLKPSYVPPSSRPIRILKPSMPSISETHVFSSSRPTPPPLSPPLTVYRPLAALAAAQEKEKAANAKRNSGRWNVRNTANIDVVTRPRSRIDDHDTAKKEDASTIATTATTEAAASVPFFLQRTEGGGVVQRDFTVGTLKRGRKVIRLQTTRLPVSVEQETPSTPQPPPPAPEPEPVLVPSTVAVEVPQTTRVIRAYGGIERLEPAVIPGRVKKTPGERMKEKFLIPSRKGPGQPKRLFAGGVNQLSSAASAAAPLAPPPVVVTPLPLINDSGLGSSPIVSGDSSSIPNAPTNNQSTFIDNLLISFFNE